jgi:hypothetical protein
MKGKIAMWYYAQNNQTKGPVEEEQLLQLVATGQIAQDTLVWQEGMSGWVPINQTPLAAKMQVSGAGPAGVPPPPPPPPVVPKTEADRLAGLFKTYWILLAVGIPLSIIVIGIFGVIAAMVIYYILLWKYWSLIQDADVRATPDQAIAYMFIPTFNLFWQFIAVWGLAKYMNKYCRDKGIQAPEINESLVLTYLLLPLGLIIPWLGWIVVPIAMLVIQIIMLNSFTKVGIEICRAKGI